MRFSGSESYVATGDLTLAVNAAITLARAGRSVLVLEAASTVGGGTRSGELTLPGFTHDICSAVHPLGVGSSFFRSLPLHEYGLEWIYSPAPLAHPLDESGDDEPEHEGLRALRPEDEAELRAPHPDERQGHDARRVERSRSRRGAGQGAVRPRGRRRLCRRRHDRQRRGQRRHRGDDRQGELPRSPIRSPARPPELRRAKAPARRLT